MFNKLFCKLMKCLYLLVLLLTGCSSVFHEARIDASKGETISLDKNAVGDVIWRQWIPSTMSKDFYMMKELLDMPESWKDEKSCVASLKKEHRSDILYKQALKLFKECMVSKGWRQIEFEFHVRPV